MAEAFVEGRPARIDAAVAAAAMLLARARQPVVAGLGADIAGIRAGLRLAERLGGAIDHMAADSVLRNLSVMRDTGLMVVSPGEVRRHADLICFVGDGTLTAWPGMLQHIAPAAQRATLVALGAPDVARACAGEGRAVVQADADDMPGMLAGLRARLAGRKVAGPPEQTAALDQLSVRLRNARYGVMVWSAESLPELAIEMLVGLIRDLNVATRFTGLPLSGPDNSVGAAQACGWLTGYPMCTGFGTGAPVHDPWAYDAVRMVDSGEADAALWISAFRPVAPPWNTEVPLVAVAAPGTMFRRAPQVLIEVAIPGRDHDAVIYSNETGALASVSASAPSAAGLPTVEAVVSAILNRIEAAA
ncbi:tungsten formylmethanofuran dehydrogenase [Rhodoligotrophos defluvii]|uniref:tungsten formylmethanofuran dehydrogenase n=1 Tax=Rhodoligotrophos defluvii TaxID=2561934 RepID=UPI0010C9D5BE|nr:tungsten formylmethanofuran dehydrogenase [Rhodoligotrophos defluvii]